MKKSTWLGILVLLAVLLAIALLIDRKPPGEMNPPVASSAPTRQATPIARIGSPPATAAAEEASENSRTRPLPRPEDRKLKPAPPLVEPAPTAAALPGKSGFVFSPFNNKVVDVRDIPPGTLVADPTYPPEEKKYFRVPAQAPPAASPDGTDHPETGLAPQVPAR